MSDDVNPKESGGKKYVAPEAARLGDVSAGRGFDCSPSGSNAVSACTTTGNLAQACTNGTGTGGSGQCTNGDNAANCPAGNGAYGTAGCHTGTGPA
ncbi:hypothetical protein JXD38_10385 [candidate division WOR-3 bacterium]|nr:hypothetical protein [candidate division WOR-3 bacterium]